MDLQNFVQNLSRNLGTQLPALVGKALGRSGQLPSFNFSDPGTRTPSNAHFQQAAEEEMGEERRGKEKRKEKEEKEKGRNCFGLQGFNHAEKVKSKTVLDCTDLNTLKKHKVTS